MNARAISLRRWLPVLVVAMVCYTLVLALPQVWGSAKPFPHTFNSMLDHLLRGRLDVDPAIIGKEGFARDGRVYAYWGIMPALLRLPMTVLPGWRELDFTKAYCLVTLLLMATVKLWTVRFVLARSPAVPRALARAMYVVVALSGAQICFLQFSLYQEVCLWAGLFAAVFVAAAVAAQHRGLGERERLVMAAAAGAALLTRVSIGIGLVAAFGLLLAVELAGDRPRWRAQIRSSVPALVALALFGLATAGVNFGRWGNPLTFADYQHYLYNADFPDRLARTATYGLFNLERIPFGLIYYFLPVWVLRGGDGQLLFDATRQRLIDSTELPPASFLLTDPLLLLLGAVAVAGWLRERGPAAVRGSAVAAGLALPALLMLSAISMCHRYRMDFYPLFEFLAFSGLAMVGRAGIAARPGLVWTLAAVSVVGSVSVGAAYLLSPFGPAQLLIADGVGRFYFARMGLL